MAINVCYKVKNPVVYNKGTKWEKMADTFLEYVSHESVDKVVKEVERLNNEKPAKTKIGTPIDWNNVEKFFVNGVNEWVNAGGLD